MAWICHQPVVFSTRISNGNSSYQKTDRQNKFKCVFLLQARRFEGNVGFQQGQLEIGGDEKDNWGKVLFVVEFLWL